MSGITVSVIERERIRISVSRKVSAGSADIGDLATSGGQAGEFMRVAAAGGIEYRDPGDVLADIGAAGLGDLSAHEANQANPHAVTAAQAGADPVGSASAAQSAAQSYADGLASNYDAAGSAAAVAGDLATHAANQANPHAVVAGQIASNPFGNLGAVTVQAALEELQADVDGRITAGAMTVHVTDGEHDALDIAGDAEIGGSIIAPNESHDLGPLTIDNAGAVVSVAGQIRPAANWDGSTYPSASGVVFNSGNANNHIGIMADAANGFVYFANKGTTDNHKYVFRLSALDALTITRQALTVGDGVAFATDDVQAGPGDWDTTTYPTGQGITFVSGNQNNHVGLSSDGNALYYLADGVGSGDRHIFRTGGTTPFVVGIGAVDIGGTLGVTGDITANVGDHDLGALAVDNVADTVEIDATDIAMILSGTQKAHVEATYANSVLRNTLQVVGRSSSGDIAAGFGQGIHFKLIDADEGDSEDMYMTMVHIGNNENTLEIKQDSTKLFEVAKTSNGAHLGIGLDNSAVPDRALVVRRYTGGAGSQRDIYSFDFDLTSTPTDDTTAVGSYRMGTGAADGQDVAKFKWSWPTIDHPTRLGKIWWEIGHFGGMTESLSIEAITDSQTRVSIGDELTVNGDIAAPNLPTADPADGSGKFWVDGSGFVRYSS